MRKLFHTHHVTLSTMTTNKSPQNSDSMFKYQLEDVNNSLNEVIIQGMSYL